MKLLNWKSALVPEVLRRHYLRSLANGPLMNKAVMKWGLREVREAIKVEMTTKRRAGVIGRLAGRYKALLAQQVDKELFG